MNRDLSGVRLIATDLDGTLLRSDLTVSSRTRSALDALRRRGVPLIPVTARQPIGLRLIAQQTGFTDWALCGNAALALHLSTGEVLFEHFIAADAQRALVTALAALIPEVRYAAVRNRGEEFVAEHGYALLADFSDHKRDPRSMVERDLSEVIGSPSQKLVARHAVVPVPDLVSAIRGLGLPGFGVTHSGAPFAEILPPGIDKSVGLAELCAHLGVDRTQVLAFGDAENDVEMLAWAGYGVAVANAVPATVAAADEVTARNDEDGVALVLERVLAAPH